MWVSGTTMSEILYSFSLHNFLNILGPTPIMGCFQTFLNQKYNVSMNSCK